MTIAAKHFDPLVGLDTHIILIPSPAGPIPTPLPHPYVGMVFDPMDYAPFIGASTYINGLPRGQAGSSGQALPPHIPMGGPFAKPPSNESEIFMGSSVVLVEDEPQSFLGMPVLSCQDIGMPAPPRPKKKSVPKSLMLPTTVVLCIPMGMLVLIGGPPTISMMAIGMRLGLGALKKLRKSKLMKKLSDKIHAAAEKAMKKLGLGDAARNAVHKGICAVTGHPVDIATGKVFTSKVDFEFAGAIPFRWERTWFSTSTYQGPLGHGWHHTYDQLLIIEEDVILYQTGDGRHVGLPRLKPGSEHFDRRERLTLQHDGNGYTIRTADGLAHRFLPISARPRNNLPLVEITSQQGNRLELRYDQWGRLAHVLDSGGRAIDLAYDQSNRVVALIGSHPDVAGQRVYVARYAYDGWGNLASVWDALGNSATFEYRQHLLAKETDRSGLSFYFTYDGTTETARCVRTWGDGGLYDHKLTYASDAKLTIVEDSLGNRTTYFHDGAVVTKVINALGAVSQSEYGEYHELLAETDPLGHRTEWKYDERGNPIERTSADGAKIEMAYGPGDRPVSAKNEAGAEWQWKYDESGRLLERTNPIGETYFFEWQGPLVVAVVDPSGNRTAMTHDPSGNVLVLLTPDAAETRFAYDAVGRLRTTTDPNGNQQHRERDLKGRVVRVVEFDGNVRELTYDSEDNVVRMRDRQHDVAYEYRGLGRIVSRSEAGTTVGFEYDTEERLVGIRNEHGYVHRFTLDPLGNVAEEHGFDGLRRSYERDAAGRITKMLRPPDRHSTYEHDPIGRIVKVLHGDGSTEHYSYAGTGDLMLAANDTTEVVLERDRIGRLIKESQGTDWVSSEYDSLGRRCAIRSSKHLLQRIRHDARGRVLAVEASAVTTTADPAEQFVAGFERDRLGLELERSLPGGIRAKWQRDRLGRPERQDVVQGERAITSKQYVWEVSARLKRVIDAMRGPIDYHFDALGNLMAAAYADGSVELRMPDAVGNLFRTQDRTDRKYGPSGQLIEASGPRGVTRYEYDLEGNLIRKSSSIGEVWRYSWNDAGMLTELVRPDGRRVEFAYDAFGRRVSKRYRGKETHWFWDGDVPLHEWVQGAPNYVEDAANEASQITSAPPTENSPGALLIAPRAPEPPERAAADACLSSPFEDDRDDEERGTADVPITWLFEPDGFAPLGKLVGAKCFGIVTDHLGTPTRMHDAAGNEAWSVELDTYGEVRELHGKRASCPFRFPGQYEDAETGLYYNRFRYYDPEGGIYIRQDPLGLARGTALYGYVHDTLVWTDPLGLHAARSWFTPQGGRRTPVGNPQMGGDNYWPNTPGSGSNDMAPSGLGRLNDSENHLMEHLDSTHSGNMAGGVLEIQSIPVHGSSLPPCGMCDEGLQAFADKHQVTVVYTQTGRRGMPVGDPKVYHPKTPCT